MTVLASVLLRSLVTNLLVHCLADLVEICVCHNGITVDPCLLYVPTHIYVYTNSTYTMRGIGWCLSRDIVRRIYEWRVVIRHQIRGRVTCDKFSPSFIHETVAAVNYKAYCYVQKCRHPLRVCLMRISTYAPSTSAAAVSYTNLLPLNQQLRQVSVWM